ncbi:MAG: proton-conducting transporter membrane subunit [Kiritimatiellia bacterium]
MIVLPFAVLVAGALIALFLQPRRAALAGCAVACLGCAIFIPFFLLGAPVDVNLRLAILFQLPIVVLGIAAAIHSLDYLKGHGEEQTGFYWFCFNLMLAAMLGTTVCHRPIPFLLVWELMGLTSAALVAFDIRSRESMRAVWIYLVACHAGAAFLILMFVEAGAAAPSAAVVFTLAVLGFGLKVGFPGLHVWLPDAHPAAPAPVSAIMSGAMIPLGLYGIIQFGIMGNDFERLIQPMGWTLLVLGLVGALLGIVFALPQKNLKRLLAYSSIEHMGIISTGLGLSFLGARFELWHVADLATVGALLHVVNHALLKGGLFLGAGSIYKAAGTLDMDAMGGLMKRMPATGATFALNAVAIAGLPPFNAFLSEFLIFLAAFMGIVHGSGAFFVASLTTAIALGLVGGFACAAFAKATSAVFLGEPRTDAAANATEVSDTMCGAAFVLLALSAFIALVGPFVSAAFFANNFPAITSALNRIGIATFLLLVIVGGLLALRFRLLPRAKTVDAGPTWDCGFAQPTARMAYTGTALTQPLMDFFAPILRPARQTRKPDGLFPTTATNEVVVKDAGMRLLWAPALGLLTRLSKRIQAAQSGHLHAYVLGMVAAVAIMFIWALSANPAPPEPSAEAPTELSAPVNIQGE